MGFAPTFYFGKNRIVNKNTITEKVREIAEEIVEKHNLELVHIEFKGSGKQQALRIFIDKEEGITHDDCSAVSHDLEKFLDEDDFIDDRYILEVSSPGIERGLYSLADFEKFKGNSAKLKTHTPIGNQRNFKGEILRVEGDEIIFQDKTNGEVRIPYEIVNKANLEFDIEEELKQAKKGKSRKR